MNEIYTCLAYAFATFFPSLPEKKKNAVSVQHFRDKIGLIKLWLMRKFTKTELGFCELICRYHWSSHERKKKSREGKRDRHVLHKKLYFQNSVSSQSVEHITLLEAEHILLFHHQDYKHQC